METIFNRHIKDSTLIEYPLQVKQFRYQEGKSTISAFKLLVQRKEDATKLQEILLCSFIHIKEAFNQ